MEAPPRKNLRPFLFPKLKSKIHHGVVLDDLAVGDSALAGPTLAAAAGDGALCLNASSFVGVDKEAGDE
jgi:hypothetical protein